MSSVRPVGSSPIATTNADYTGLVSSESILLMLSNELKSIDSTLDEMKSRIENNTKKQRQLNRLREMVRGSSDDGIDVRDLSEEDLRILLEVNAWSLDDLSRIYYYFVDNGMNELADMVSQHVDRIGGALIPRSDIEGIGASPYLHVAGSTEQERSRYEDQVLSFLNDKLSSINTGQDMMMIQFQDLMSRRSNRINMATNIISKLNSAHDSVVSNMR